MFLYVSSIKKSQKQKYGVQWPNGPQILWLIVFFNEISNFEECGENVYMVDVQWWVVGF